MEREEADFEDFAMNFTLRTFGYVRAIAIVLSLTLALFVRIGLIKTVAW